MTEKTIKKLEQLIQDADPILATAQKARNNPMARSELRQGEYTSYSSSVLHFLGLILDENSPYLKEYKEISRAFNVNCILTGTDILKRVLQDVKDGWLLNIKGIVSAEIFSDFLDMSSHLLGEGYKDPAAVIVGSVLEEHLRNLAVKNLIDIYFIDSKGKRGNKKASVMNDDLLKAKVYNSIDHKSVTAWLDLRNKAAHGQYSEYSAEQVINLHQDVTSFIGRNPL